MLTNYLFIYISINLSTNILLHYSLQALPHKVNYRKRKTLKMFFMARPASGF